METATKVYIAIAAVVFVVTGFRFDWSKGKTFVIAVIGGPLGTIAGIIAANLVAGVMVILDKKLSWWVEL